MSNKTLENIDKDLDIAKEYVKSAGRRAGGVGDRDGEKKCNEMEEKIDDLREDFGSKGR